MNRIIIISTIFISFLLSQILFSQDVILKTQADVDAFDPATSVINGNLFIGDDKYPYNSNISTIVNLSNITTVNGDLTIKGTYNLKSINSLSSIKFISGNITITQNSGLTNLDGFSKITSFPPLFEISNNNSLKKINSLLGISVVTGTLKISSNKSLTNIDNLFEQISMEGQLSIYNNDALINIDGLSSLDSIKGSLSISYNYILTNIDGLSGLTSIEGQLSIFNNDALINIDGLSGLTSIAGSLYIEGNKKLTNVDGLSRLKSFDRNLRIVDNDALTNINGLSGITSISQGTSLDIWYNDALDNVDGLSGVENIEGHLVILDNDKLNNVGGLFNLDSITGSLYIGENEALANIKGLSGLRFVDGQLGIGDNDALTNIDGLSSLDSIKGKLYITDNDALTNIDGLSGIKSIGNTYIKGNRKLTNINGLSLITSIARWVEIVSNDALTNIDGLSGLTSITGYLYIEKNEKLTNINGLSGIKSLAGTLSIVENNALTNIDGLSNIKKIEFDFPNSTGSLVIDNSALTNVDGLKGLETVDGQLSISNNFTLTNIDGLSNISSGNGTLIINNNSSLITIDCLTKNSSFDGSLFIWNNSSLANINGLSGIHSIKNMDITNNDALTNVDGLSGLTTVAGTLKIIQNDKLLSLSGFSGIKSVDKLEIFDNPALTDCCDIQPLICKYGANSSSFQIYRNHLGCMNAWDISTTLCYDHNYLEGKVNFDSDSNGCDSINVSIPNIKIRVMQNSDNDFVISDKSGDYSYFLREAGEIVLLPEYDNKLFKIEPDTVIINYPGDSLNLVHDFCVTPVKKFNDLEITIIPLTQARPGFEAAYEISYKNKGTNIMSDKIEFYYDDNLVSFINAVPPVDSMNENSIRWYYKDLVPYEQRKIIVKFKLNKPTDNPPLDRGDLLTYAAKIYPVVEDITHGDNSFRLNQTVVNSLDPNDKTCLDGDEFDVQKVGDYVNYLIRFENKGTAEAVNIKVVDVIDTSLFDISTLEITSSSHNCFTNIYKDTVEFLFEHIFLDFHDDKNDGFIAFKIRTRPTLESGTILKNTANIYFDYNLPVKTNVATTIVKEIVATKETDTGSWQIFPNPSAGSFYIGTDCPGNYSVTLYDTYGKAVYTSTKEIRNLTELQYYTLPMGLYFLKIENQGKVFHNEKVLIFR